MAEAGIPPASGVSLLLDGKKHRYKLFDDKGAAKSGEYCFYLDDHPAGWFKSYKAKHGAPYTTWAMKRGGETPDAQTRDRLIAEAERRKEEREKEKSLTQRQAIKRARDIWNAATPFSRDDIKHNAYIKNKKLASAPSARRIGADIVLPLQNELGEIVSIQRILPDGRKLLHPKAPKRGNFILLEPRPLSTTLPTALPTLPSLGPDASTPLPSGEAEPPQGVEADGAQIPEKPEGKKSLRDRLVWICEGWATGVTIWEATGCRVVVAVDAGNLLPVGQKIKALWPELELVGAPDWDRSAGNPGMAYMFELQDDLGIAAVPPKFEEGETGTDWNDFCCLHGLEATRKALLKGLKEAHDVPDFGYRARERLFPHITESTGHAKKTVGNLCALLRFLNISIKYNVVTKNLDISVPNRTFHGDNRQNAIDGYIASKCVEFGLPEKTWESYVWTVSSNACYNPVKDWILSVPWDGHPRIPHLMDTISTPLSYPHDFKETLIAKWLVSSVAAVFVEEGYHGRGVLTLQGRQSKGKTSWFKRLIPEEHQRSWFGEGMTLNVDNKDSVKQVVSKWITELGELEGTFKRSDMNKLKGFVTLEQDELRLPYARSESKYPRRTVFAATVNDRNFLIDETGNTRWWVIECANIDYFHDIDTQQLFAEVYENLFLKGESWWLSREEELRLEAQNAEFKVASVVEDLLSRRLLWQEHRQFWTWRTVSEALMECGIDRPTSADIQRGVRVIKDITGQECRRSGKNRSRVYLLPPADKHVSGEDKDDITE
jgi:putative DNA primase/helicase